MVAERPRFELANRVTPGYGISSVPAPKTGSFRGLNAPQFQFDLNGTSPALRLFFNGTLFLEMP
jgi:hypothetical protein